MIAARSFECTLDFERPIAATTGQDAAQRLAETLTHALDEAVRKVGDEVVESLRRSRVGVETSLGRR